jgi:hypothetical protein
VICGDVRRHRLVAERDGQAFEQSLETFLVATIDATLFAQNLSLAFESVGLGICYIGGIRNRLHEVDALLELPLGVFPLYGICVGTPERRPSRKPRLPLEAVLYDNAYPDDESALALIDEYDKTMAEYYEGRGVSGRAWSPTVARRFTTRKRPNLAGFYESKGAKLA